jgi:hypothetical protein
MKKKTRNVNGDTIDLITLMLVFPKVVVSCSPNLAEPIRSLSSLQIKVRLGGKNKGGRENLHECSCIIYMCGS